MRDLAAKLTLDDAGTRAAPPRALALAASRHAPSAGVTRSTCRTQSCLPDAVTASRLCAAPLLVWLIAGQRWALAAGTLAGAGVSDALDGWLARRAGPTRDGAAFDALADKTCLAATLVALAAQQRVPVFLAMIVIGRDLAMLTWFAATRRPTIGPMLVSKLHTASLFALLVLVLVLGGAALDVALPVRRLALAIVLLTSASAVAYLVRLRRR